MVIEYCPKWAPAETATQVLLIGDWRPTTVYLVAFGGTSVPTTWVRSGVISCECPPIQAAIVPMTIRAQDTAESEAMPFEYKPVGFAGATSTAAVGRSNSRMEDLEVSAPGSDQRDSEEKDLRDITWKDFLLQRDLAKLQITESSSPLARDEWSDLTSKDRQLEYTAARTIQHAFRRYQAQTRKKKAAVNVIETTYKQYKQYKEKRLKNEEAAAVKIQSSFRAHVQRQDFLSSRRAAVVVQRSFRYVVR